MRATGVTSRSAEWRERLKHGLAQLRSDFARKPETTRLLRRHCQLVDALLCDIWKASGLPSSACLVAVGGYGRGELFPHSDVDILILLSETEKNRHKPELEALIGQLWDIGLAIGHSVRTPQECIDEAARDVTVLTNLLEARLLRGNPDLYHTFSVTLSQTLDALAFLEAKIDEQTRRHARFNDTAYNLEPNLKESPGGLRDLQTILWVARGAGLGTDWNDLVRNGLMTQAEARQIRRQELFLQNLRIRLHFLANRREDRLLFDHQSALASQLGLHDARRRASEQLMQRYYRSAKLIGLMNEILLQGMRERLCPAILTKPVKLGHHFVARDGMLDIASRNVFLRYPDTILECFHLLQRHPTLSSMSVTTVRALWQARHQINQQFRNDPRQRRAFMRLLRQPSGVTHALHRMHRYGILGRYIPAFGRITGQMQHDLFHVYTVDEHILNVVRNLRRFAVPEHAHEFPLCSQLMARFERPETLYLAALFHDIAKGRGGDHSTLGAIDARRFCKQHALSDEDTALVSWLVAHHLCMSTTAQHKDISDPDVVASFARLVGDTRRLTALYLLTVADIRGTSPHVWNAWKSRLLEDLYHATRRWLNGQQPDTAQEIALRQSQAQEILGRYGISLQAVLPLWKLLEDGYFLRQDARDIAWQTRLLMTHVETHHPIVRARLSPAGDGIQVMVYAFDRRDLFARICAFFERLNYSVVEARIHTTRHGYALHSYLVLDESDRSVRYSGLIAHIEKELTARLETTTPPALPLEGRVSRRVKHFPITPSVSVEADPKTPCHILTLTAGDRPGLLSRIAHVLLAHGARLHTARINTLGNRAEDVFLISGEKYERLPPETIQAIEHAVLQTLQG
ncbi:MAG: [protein-PII] uridylyltransferase [Methylophilaceae bacterium]|nr:[protein-PII] uridylyltransferase [Methylophilaceae bacterium]